MFILRRPSIQRLGIHRVPILSIFQGLELAEPPESPKALISCEICTESFPSLINLHKRCKCCKKCLKTYSMDKIKWNTTTVSCPMCRDYKLELGFISRKICTDLRKKIRILRQEFILNRKKCTQGHTLDISSKYPNYLNCNTCKDYYCIACEEKTKYFHRFWCKNKKIFKKIKNKKPCPECLILIDKIEGCDHMLCGYCRTTFCWKCLETYHGNCKCNNIF
jgi:hypothetical protein